MALVAARHALFLWTSVLTVCSCWLTSKTVSSGCQFNRPLQLSQAHSQSPTARRSSVLKRRNESFPSLLMCGQTTPVHLWTSICNVCFTLSSLVFTVVYFELMLSLYWLRHPREWHNRQRDRRVNEHLTPWLGLSTALQLFGYFMMSIWIMERVHLVFRNSAFMLSERELKGARSMTVLIGLEFMLGVLTFFLVNSTVTLIIVAPGLLAYPVLTGWLSWRLLSNTRRLCRNVSRDQETESELIQIALRLTVATFTALTSTVLSGVVWLIWLVWRDPFVTLFLRFSRNTDFLINVFSLYCTLNSSEREYSYVFGTLHNFILNRFLDSHSNTSN